jgi:hypothetical protein
MAPWKPTDSGMPGQSLPPSPKPHYPDCEQKVEVNPNPEGVAQRTTSQERKRLKNQRYRKNKKLRLKAAEEAEQEAILNSILDSTVAELEHDDEKEDDIGRLSINFANAVQIEGEADDGMRLRQVAKRLWEIVGEHSPSTDDERANLADEFQRLCADEDAVRDTEERLDQLTRQVIMMGPNTPDNVAAEFFLLLRACYPDDFEEELARRTNTEVVMVDSSEDAPMHAGYCELQRAVSEGPVPELDPSAPVSSCMICMEEFAPNNGPRGNFFRYHGRPNNCSCSEEYDYCNICFVRNFRTNATPCPDFGCPNLHMECPTCRGIINVCPNLAAWCQDNYETIDMIETTMQSGGTVTFLGDVSDTSGGGTVGLEF